MEDDLDQEEQESKMESKPSGSQFMTVLRAHDVGSYLDPLGLSDVKNSKILRFGQRIAITLLVLMALAELFFLGALIIRSLL